MTGSRDYPSPGAAKDGRADVARAAARGEPSRSQEAVMVVDDTPANLRLLQAQLRHQDYRVLVFPDGPAALAAARREPPDLILLDVNMPEMDGFELCARLKADDALAPIPVLFISARGHTGDKVRGLAAGAVDYITKPFQAEEVVARIDTHLTIRRQARQLEHALTSLQELEHQRDRLVHMVAHDLRSPLTVAQATFEMMRAEGMAEDCRRLADRGVAVTRRMAQLVNAMLDMSTLESGCLELELSEIDVNDLLRAAVNETRIVAEERAVNLVESESPLLVACDTELVSRVVHNLLANAVQHTDPRTGTITVRAMREHDEILVEIVDDGPGVPKDDRERIFEKRARATRGLDSHGLGLAFSKMAIETHGGRIGVRPAAEKGSVFWFTLSRSDEPCV